MLLSELQTGERAVVVRVSGHGAFRKRIIEMGFIKGVTVEAVLNAPLKDPIKYRIMNFEVSLRRSDARKDLPPSGAHGGTAALPGGGGTVHLRGKTAHGPHS